MRIDEVDLDFEGRDASKNQFFPKITKFLVVSGGFVMCFGLWFNRLAVVDSYIDVIPS